MNLSLANLAPILTLQPMAFKVGKNFKYLFNVHMCIPGYVYV